MRQFILFFFTAFLFQTQAQASWDDPNDIRVYSTNAQGKTVRIPTVHDQRKMHLYIENMKFQFETLSNQAMRRGVSSSEAVDELVLNSLRSIVMCPFRDLRAPAYIVLSRLVLEENLFKLAYTYALDRNDNSALDLQNLYQQYFQGIINNCHPEVNDDDRRLKESVEARKEIIAEFVKNAKKDKEYRNQNPQIKTPEYHELEMKTLHDLEREQWIKVASSFPRAAINLIKITVFLYILGKLILTSLFV